MVVRTESDIMRLYKSVDKLYLAVLENGEIRKTRKSLIKPGEEAVIFAEKDNSKLMLVDEDNKVLYLFTITLDKDEGYRITL